MAASWESEVLGTQVKIHAQDEVKQPEEKFVFSGLGHFTNNIILFQVSLSLTLP